MPPLPPPGFTPEQTNLFNLGLRINGNTLTPTDRALLLNALQIVTEAWQSVPQPNGSPAGDNSTSAIEWFAPLYAIATGPAA